MGNQPGVARMDTSDPDVKPSPSLRKSSEAFSEQRKSIASPPGRASSEHQESLLVARSILSDVVNCVTEEPSQQPPSEHDEESTMHRRTLSGHSLSVLLAGTESEQVSKNSTFTVVDDEENALVDLREVSCDAGAMYQGNASLGKLASNDQSGMARCSGYQSDTSWAGTPNLRGTAALGSSLLDDSPIRSELAFVRATDDSGTTGSILNITQSEECPDKGKTEGALPVDSEAGPEVAQFSEEEFLTAVQHFNEDLDFLQKVGSCPRLGRTSLGRCSQFLNSDPLRDFDPLNSPKGWQGAPEADSTEVIDLNTSETKEQMFSEKEMSQALKYQELMFQERLLKKDQESVRQLESARQEYERIRIRLQERDEAVESQEKTLTCLVK
ncbi:hypothetical protein HPB48_017987 [Haemaphysalis longicornis]|uniref:Uncharacterized protein n=1 Tax=Haemaphysalis longicornis TaxID=44386 RepID=A0A9J6FHP2_HAELO|nr:hypothetical protein HPB48_017987 [Haemaphysalis longicornis]